jgi:formylglycine-generating enzyme required for sulfatase activity
MVILEIELFKTASIIEHKMRAKQKGSIAMHQNEQYRMTFRIILIFISASYGCSNNANQREKVSSDSVVNDSTAERDSSQRDTDSEVRTDSDSIDTFIYDRLILDDYLSTGFGPIASGTFVFGSPETEPCRGPLTEEQVEVTLTYNFEMAITELTQEVWQAAGFSNPSYPKQGGDLPVNYVNWFDTLAFCNRLSEYAGLETCYDLTSCSGAPGKGCIDEMDTNGDCLEQSDLYQCGTVRKFEHMDECKGYRLPTSPEWEYAVRAGKTTATYNGDTLNFDGDCQVFDVLEPIAWYCFNSSGEAHSVAQKQPNAWGLYDMLGNVQEWVDSVYTGFGLQDDEGKTGPLTNPMGAQEADEYYRRSTRGQYYGAAGCWVRSAWRSAWPTEKRTAIVGFRPIRTLPAK